MNHEILRHEKVRFRREEITPLEELPSAVEQGPLNTEPGRTVRLRRMAVLAAASFSALVILLVGGVYLAGLSGVGSERLRREAEAAINVFAAADVDVASRPARLSLDGSRFLGLEVPSIQLTDKVSGEEFVQAGSLRFGLRLWPLLSGDVQLRSIRLADARIVPAAIPGGSSRDWSAGLRNERGLIEPDLLGEAVFSAIHRLFDAFEVRSTRRIQMENVELVLAGSAIGAVRILEAELSHRPDGGLAFVAEMAFGERTVSVEGSAERSGAERRIASLQVSAISPDAPRAKAPVLPDEIGRLPQIYGAFSLSVTGEEGAGGDADRLRASLSVPEGALHFSDGETLAGSVELVAGHLSGSGKIEIERLLLGSGRSRLAFHGAVGPAAAPGDADETPSYRYELVSDGSTIATADATEPALDFFARLAGAYLPAEKRLNAHEIGIRTGPGEALGTASIDFAEGRTPSVVLAIDVPSMPVAHVKQLWPWPAARGARLWTMRNAFGGMVKNSRLRLSVESGRLGNGVPLSPEEITGHFEVADTRFDVAGDIPPMRDAHGVVDFRGTDVDVSLSSGTVFMPGGRTVAASEGTFRIRDAHIKPVIGRLDIDLAGAAPAVVQLASYRPIEAMKELDLEPKDFEGEISGNVQADIPLMRHIPRDQLSWNVSLQYSALSIGKPFQGQMVTEAEGTIELDPAKAVIQANAKLNGMPAELDLVEPIGRSVVERRRDIAVMLDDKGREALAPGLSTLISGPVHVELDQQEEGGQWITADLTKASLRLPFAGWTKGPGVPATASFALKAGEEGARISDFTLDGNSFGASGEIVLSGGGLASARFDEVRLNRDDRVAMDVRRSGDGYAVSVTGEAMDARPLIKQFTAGAGKAGPAGKPTPLAIKADVKNVAGFGGEVLANVKIDYKGAGSTIEALTISAVSRSGGAISVMNSNQGQGQSVQMQSADAGALLRFLNIYKNMEGGSIRLALDAQGKGPLRGQIDARDFWVVDEPRLGSIVSTAPAGDGRSLNQTVSRDIDASRVKFDRGFAQVEKGEGYLAISNGVLRGPLIGTTFQGTLFDPEGNMSVTGTFMPAYGVNSLFAEIPLIGQILGNGRDRGLIGITYKLAGDAKSPQLQVNPLSAVAPGIFRQIFEFN